MTARPMANHLRAASARRPENFRLDPQIAANTNAAITADQRAGTALGSPSRSATKKTGTRYAATVTTPLSAGPLIVLFVRSPGTPRALAAETRAIKNAITAVMPHGTNVIKTVPICTPTPLANSHRRVPSPTASRRVAESAADQPRTPIPAQISQLTPAGPTPPIQGDG